MSEIKAKLTNNLTLITLATGIMLAIIAFVVVPLQGALQSSTELINPTLNPTDFPIQDILGTYGRSIMIAFVMLSHTLYANLHLGGSWVAVISESLYHKNGKQRFKRIARSITLFNVMLFSLGATFAAAGIVFFISFMPEFASNLFHIYFWPFFIEAILFATEIIFLYVYWFTWDKINKKWHQFLGYGYAISVFFQTLMINMVAAGMLTPGADSIVYSGEGLLTMDPSVALNCWFNPTALRLQWHRIFGSISYFGFILAFLGMFHYKDKNDINAKKYWDWVGSYGLLWGLIGLVMQPAFGLIYMMAIKDAEPMAFHFIMHGPRAWEMLLMVTLLSALFLVVIAYFIDRRERILNDNEYKVIKKLYKVLMLIAVIAAFFLVQPAWFGSTYRDDAPIVNPIGVMDFKYPALVALVVVGALILMIDIIMIADPKEAEWGKMSKTARYSAISAGILGMWIIIVMGYVRESARSPFTIYTIIPVEGSANHPTPIQVWIIFIIWAIILAMTTFIFWITSKVTAHHPERAEGIEEAPPSGGDKKTVTATNTT